VYLPYTIGPDPRGALHFIDRLELYPTIFANHQDEVGVDTSSWALAYNALEELLHSRDVSKPAARVRDLLVHDSSETYYAWIITAFAPWSAVPDRIQKGPKAKPLPPRAAEIARDSLRSDNKTITLLRDAARSWRSIVDIKSSLLENRMSGTAAEIRQQIGLHIRQWNKDWRLCCLLSILQEISQGGDFSEGEILGISFIVAELH
jgi:hypothetical protein